MIDTLLVLQIVIGILLVIAILLQKTSTDGISSLAGNNMNVVDGNSATNFISKTTIFLVITFMCNALVLANLSSKKEGAISKKIQDTQIQKEENSIPIAK